MTVFAATGLHLGRSTRIEGADHARVYQAIDMLRMVANGEEIDVAEQVVVIGGGNVAMDITRTMARLQKQKYGKVGVLATCLETEDIMPADREEVVEACEEGALIEPGWGPKSIQIEGGAIKGLHVARCLSVFDENHRRFYEGEVIVESIGQGADLSYLGPFEADVKLTPRRKVDVDAHFQSSLPWLFVVGDIVEGPDVIHGIANGHAAAKGIDAYLKGE